LHSREIASHSHTLHNFPTRRSSDLPARITEQFDDLRIVQSFKPLHAHYHSFTFCLLNLLRQPLEGLYTLIAIRKNIDAGLRGDRDRKSTRLNSSHVSILYAVFCLK